MWFKKEKEKEPVVDRWPLNSRILEAERKSSYYFSDSIGVVLEELWVRWQETINYRYSLPDVIDHEGPLMMYSAESNSDVCIRVTRQAADMFENLQKLIATIASFSSAERLAVGVEVVEKRYGQVLDVLKENHYCVSALVSYEELELIEDSPDYAALEAQVKARMSGSVEKCERVSSWLYSKNMEVKALVETHRSSGERLDEYVERKRDVQELSVKVRKNLETPSVSVDVDRW